MKPTRTLAAVVLLACALPAGCGGDGDDKARSTATTTTAAPLTKAQYVKRADAICRASMAQITRAGARLRASVTKTATLPPQAQIVTFLKQTSVPTYERMLDRLRALAPPADDAGEIDGYLADLAVAIDRVKADPERYAKTSTADPFADSNARAKRYGMESCGS